MTGQGLSVKYFDNEFFDGQEYNIENSDIDY